MKPDPMPELLDRLRLRPERAAVVTDFDGTLAPIVDDPSESRPLPGTPELLCRLAAWYARVAVVSGRPVGFLVDRLDLDANPCELVVSGLYGLELRRGAAVDVHPEAERWREIVGLVADAATEQAPEGVRVERKGLSVTLHVRTAPEHSKWVETWVESQASVTKLAVHPARMSWELRPPVKRDKGTVVAELVAGLDAACFVGDDVGDLTAFDTLDRLEAGGAYVLKVGVRSDESPPELIERAHVVVDGPAGAVDVLRRLLPA